jgi:hypothetical protein
VDTVVSVVNAALIIEGKLIINTRTLKFINSSNSIVKGDLDMASSAAMTIELSSTASSPIRIDGCVRLSGTLTVVGRSFEFRGECKYCVNGIRLP